MCLTLHNWKCARRFDQWVGYFDQCGGREQCGGHGRGWHFFQPQAPGLSTTCSSSTCCPIPPSQVFGETMAQNGRGCGSTFRRWPLPARSRVIGWAAKSAIDNFTRWLAVELCLAHGPGLRVNAIAPGFLVGSRIAPSAQLRHTLTPRGQQIISHTNGRFGEPDNWSAVWLCSDAALCHRDRRAGGWRVFGLCRGGEAVIEMVNCKLLAMPYSHFCTPSCLTRSVTIHHSQFTIHHYAPL